MSGTHVLGRRRKSNRHSNRPSPTGGAPRRQPKPSTPAGRSTPGNAFLRENSRFADRIVSGRCATATRVILSCRSGSLIRRSFSTSRCCDPYQG
jgi:hypothetical protein